MKAFSIQIEGMSCMHCVMRVKKALEGLGIQKVNVDLKKNSASGEYDENHLTQMQINESIKKAGYSVRE